MDLIGRAVHESRRAIAVPSRIARAGVGLLRAAEQVPVLLLQVTALVSAAQVLLIRVDEITGSAESVVQQVEGVRIEASTVVADIAVLQRRSAVLVGSTEPLVAALAQVEPVLVVTLAETMQRLQPLLTAVAGLDPDVPGEAGELIHRSLPLIEELAVIALPLMRQVQEAFPEIRDILAVVSRLEPVLTDVETRIAGLPGAGFLLKRGERELQAAAEDD